MKVAKTRLDKALVTAIFITLLVLPLLTSNFYYLRLAGSAALYIALTLGLNVVTGFAGILDLGYVAFFGIGAYTYALLNSYQLGIHLPFLVSLPLTGVVGFVFALVLGLPTLRLRGDYLAIVTLAYGQMVRLLINNLDRPVNLTNGPSGITGVDVPLGLGINMFGLAPRLYVIIILAGAVYLATSRLSNSKYGRGWMAMRDDANAAACMGIEVPRYRLMAFVYGGTVASIVGACFAMWQGAVFPTNFSMHELITVLCMLALGGTGSVVGVVVGAVTLVIVPELLRGYQEYRMVVFGILLVAGMRWRPQGLIPRRSPQGKMIDSENESFTIPKIDGAHLKVEGLSVAFGGLKALEQVSFEINPGEVLGVIGPNGAGKSTLINAITGFYRPSAGLVDIDGHDVTGMKPHKTASYGIARTFQNIRLFSDLSVEENVLVGHHRRLKVGFLSTIFSLPKWRRREAEARDHIREVLAFLGHGLVTKRYNEVAGLTYGDKRRVELARALVSNPRILLLDEPAAGMTEQEIEELIANIKSLNQAGYTMLLIEHHINVIRSVCHKVLVLDHGQELAYGSPDQVLADTEVAKAYLGETSGVLPLEHKRTCDVDDMSEPLLKVSGIKVSYGAEDVLKGLDIEVKEGHLVCLVGSNAAGKTTTLRTIIGDLRPSSGNITFMGHAITGVETPDITHMGIGMVPEGRRVFSRMSVTENLEMGAYSCKGRLTQGLDEAFSLFPILADRRHQLAGTLSGGEQQMLAIARALMPGPSLILLDEPTMGLAPVMVEKVMATLLKINTLGTSILMVEQNATVAAKLADELYVLHQGIAKQIDRKVDSSLLRSYLG